MILSCIWCWGSGCGALGNVEHRFIAIRVIAPDRILAMGQIELSTFKLCKKWVSAHLKMLSTKGVYKSYISNVYVLTGFGIKWPTMVDMPWKPTKPKLIYI